MSRSHLQSHSLPNKEKTYFHAFEFNQTSFNATQHNTQKTIQFDIHNPTDIHSNHKSKAKDRHHRKQSINHDRVRHRQ